MNHAELIEKLGGVNAVARLLCIKPPSVTGWSRTGVIPEQRLIRLAVIAEQRGIAKRQEIFPKDCKEIWPELRDRADAPKQPETSESGHAS